VNILVIGASGMLGNRVVRTLAENPNWNVCGTVRDDKIIKQYFPENLPRLLCGVDVMQEESLNRAFLLAKPDVVVNCVGLVKSYFSSSSPMQAIQINALLPHRLAVLCGQVGARFIHISTDCVFSGKKGNYSEDDPSDAVDLYGRTKYLGEVSECNAFVLRTSMIGHELGTCHGLLEWFLSQSGSCHGFVRAIFSGLPTVELAMVIEEHIIPNAGLSGVYQVAARPINKHDLLKLIADTYKKDIMIIPDDEPVIDRSLDGSRFQMATGYVAPDWSELIHRMHQKP
jgi:dTDP-4-dehydrorhamnose reductase